MSTLGRFKGHVLRRIAVRENVSHGRDLHVGPGSVIWAPSTLRIGNNVYVGKNCTIEVDGEIGDETLIANQVGIVGKLDHDFSAVGVPVRSAPWVGDRPEQSHRTIIGADVWIGYGAIVLSGVVIGDSTVVAAGSLVTRSLPSNSIVMGTPAVVVRPRYSSDDFERHWRTLTELGVQRLTDQENCV